MGESIANNRLIAESMKDSYVTITKGIGIILMVLGHSVGEYGDYLTPVRAFIYMFHMPLFLPFRDIDSRRNILLILRYLHGIR